VLGPTVQNIVAVAIWRLGLLHFWNKISDCINFHLLRNFPDIRSLLEDFRISLKARV